MPLPPKRILSSHGCIDWEVKRDCCSRLTTCVQRTNTATVSHDEHSAEDCTCAARRTRTGRKREGARKQERRKCNPAGECGPQSVAHDATQSSSERTHGKAE